MPRAAISVATNTRTLPALKLANAAVRALWLLLQVGQLGIFTISLARLETSEMSITRGAQPSRGTGAVRYWTTCVSDAVEFDWIEKKLNVGNVEMTIDMETERCVMTRREQGPIARANQILKVLGVHTKLNFGVYADVVKDGSIRMGQTIAR